MANPEIPGNAPQNNLGVKSMNRGNLINFLLFRDFVGGGRGRKGGGGGGGGGGGRTRREMINDMKMLEHKYRLQDEIEQARTARAVEESAQKDANAYHAANRFFVGGTIPGVSQAHTAKEIENVEDMPEEGAFESAGGTNARWKKGKKATGGQPENPPIVQQDGPPQAPRAKKRTAADARLELNALTEKYGSEQGEVSDEEWDDYLGRASALANAHDIAARDESRKANSKAKKKAGGGEVAPYSPEVIAGGKVRKNTPADDRLEVEVGLEETKNLGNVNEDASIDTGTAGNRPAPKGQSGAVQGTQFNQ